MSKRARIQCCEARERMRGIDVQLDLVSGWIDTARAAGDHDRAEELLNRHDELMRERRKMSAVYEGEVDHA